MATKALKHVVLVVEGDPIDARRAIATITEATPGACVVTVATLQGARAALTAGLRPAWVLVDADLPDGPGLDLVRWLREQRDPALILMPAVVTARLGPGTSEDSERLLAQRAKASGLVVKPDADTHHDRALLDMARLWGDWRQSSGDRR